MRKFSIQNQYGEKIELQGGSIFFHSPEGLGFANKVEYMESDSFFIATRREPEQVLKSGSLLFKPQGAYQSYFDFVNWLLSAETLTLGYNPSGTQYYMDVDVISIDKGELTTGGALDVPVTFAPISPIYSPLNLNLQIGGGDLGSIKMYNYTYPHQYAATGVSGEIEFTVDAQISSDFSFVIEGPVSEPVITATRLDTNAVIGEIDLSSVSVTAGEVLRFSTVPTSAGATLETSGGAQDLTSYLGLSSNVPTFFQLPANVPVQFALTAESISGVTVDIRVYRYYRSV